MGKFELAYAITMKHEGGYAHNPDDTGGMTYKGVARNFNPDWTGWLVVDAGLKKSRNTEELNAILAKNSDLQANVLKFYKEQYWDVNRLDSIIDQNLCNKLFDVGVNMGVRKAALMLQEALNLTNVNGRAYPDITPDGIVGRTTIGLTNNHPRTITLLGVLKGLQAERYLNIMRNNPSQEAFAVSWFSRV